ncbi:MAG TPA: terminase small subunit [Reyranella sp.]|nr:terminase small subunit [Reyranella sp.]
MPTLPNPKWERFCQELLVDDNQTQAYIRAGYPSAGANRSAARLMDRPEVAARMAELRAGRSERIAARVEITQDWVVDSLVKLHAMALEKESMHNIRHTVVLLGKHVGMWPTRPAEVKGKTLSDLICKTPRFDEPGPE